MKRTTEIALAAFLHDIGKVFQRAEAPLSDQARRMASQICPTYQGRSSHLHVLWTNDFLEEHLGWLPPTLDRAYVNQLASHHHRPSDPEHYLISEGDRLASGHDRREAESAEQAGYKKTPLLSVFGQIGFDRQGNHDSGCHLPQVLRPDESVFPQDNPERSLVKEYAAVCKVIADSLRSWPTIPESMVCAAIECLSMRCLTTIPASTIDEPDVSLHDHARLGAAFASAIHAALRDGELDQHEVTNRSADRFILASGDLSGIQNYLFDMPQDTRRGMARACRARSFYLAMLTHAASVRLLQALGLTDFNRVMDAGGRFVLLTQNTPAALKALDDARREMDEWCAHRHAGSLTINLDWSLRCRGQDFMGDSFPDLHRRLQRAVDTSKRRKLAGWLQENGHWSTQHQVLPFVHDRALRMQQYEADIELGRCLPEACYVGLWQGTPPSGMLKEPRDVLGLRMQLYREPPSVEDMGRSASFFGIRWPESNSEWIPFRDMASYVPRLNKTDVDTLLADPDSSRGTGDEDAPTTGRPATFEDLALFSRRWSGDNAAKRSGQAAIACLKADADRLGFLFSNGFGADISFGRVATLSRTMDFFFRSFLSGRFAQPPSDHPDYRHVYTVFAGGDDLMLIGPWHVMLDLAADLHKWFAKLSGDNPDVTLSAGLAMGHGRVPVSTLACVAEEQLEAAKNQGRNRICLFNDVFQWNDYQSAMKDARRLDDILTQGEDRGQLPLKSGFVYRLLQYEKMARKVEEARSGQTSLRLEHLHGELTWRSHLSYDIERNIRRRIRREDYPAVQDDLNWLESLVGVSVRATPTRRLKLVATYALYRNRGG
ncbi:MAG: type III-A CRISPR-associated protein Cas10/Csm1 [Phycisphaerae bacterium]